MRLTFMAQGCRLFEKGLNPMQVAAVTRHKTLQMLKRYTHLRAEDLAKMLGLQRNPAPPTLLLHAHLASCGRQAAGLMGVILAG